MSPTPLSNNTLSLHDALPISDLRNLVTAEEAYFADSVKYSATIGAGGVIFTQSTGNTVPAVNTTADGWTANIKNVNRSEEHTSELQSLRQLVCRLLLEQKSK